MVVVRLQIVGVTNEMSVITPSPQALQRAFAALSLKLINLLNLPINDAYVSLTGASETDADESLELILILSQFVTPSCRTQRFLSKL